MILRGAFGLLLIVVLFALVATLAVLFSLSQRSKLRGNTLLYQVDISVRIKNALSLPLTPYSIIPTLLAIGVKLWWGTIVDVFKRLQPFVEMTAKPTKVSRSFGLTYATTSLPVAPIKAMINRHWLLALILFGAVLTEICKYKPSNMRA
jgi:Protein of unknown function (DUF3433)